MNDPAYPASPDAGGNAPKVPTAWFGSEEEKAFVARLAATSRHTLLLDYDGTLAPFHPDKMKAFPYPGVAETLQQLDQRPDTRVVLVTGRRAADLLDLVEVAKDVEIWGCHGREHIDRNREYTLYPPSTEQSATLAQLQREIEAGLRGTTLKFGVADLSITSHDLQPSSEAPEPLEQKPASIAIHWRGLAAPSQEVLRNLAEEAYRLHGNASIERLAFESGVEFRAVGYTKAFAVTHELERSGEDSLIAYLGDDLTDEDAFAALRGRGESLLVRSELRPSRARYCLKPPEELLRYLRSWL